MRRRGGRFGRIEGEEDAVGGSAVKKGPRAGPRRFDYCHVNILVGLYLVIFVGMLGDHIGDFVMNCFLLYT